MNNKDLKDLRKTYTYEVRFEDPFKLWDFTKQFKHHFKEEMKIHGRVLYFETEDEMNLAKILK